MVATIADQESGLSVRGKLNSVITGGAAVSTTVKTGAYNAVAGDLVLTDSSGGAFTVTLPTSPGHGDTVGVLDAVDSWPTNNVTVGRNGQNIEGLAENLVLSGARLCLLRFVTGHGWKIATLLATARPSASDVIVTPAGNIAATDAQAALEELDTEKLPTAGTGLVEQISGHIETVADKTYVLDLKAPYAYTINSLAAKTASGTCTAKLTIDGVNVTGITALAVSSTEDFDDATAANVVSVGNTVALVVSGNSGALDLQFTVKYTR